ncbi:unnamed protein product [Brachionus calyciflorus]|uniref:Uncharacterized protein n=1 Tax=Brachionus calyciflorus TaxID=104777 RepID=A0A813WAJ5_9BILA|nr:unnamed protein product [Brachionus calyciflorus]
MLRKDFLLSFVFALIFNSHGVFGQCWFGSYGRGVGWPLSTCKSGQELNGLLCYPQCSNGYYGAGPVCWSNCRESYSDHGALCTRGPHIYGKGCCCVNLWFWKNGCCGNCPSGYNDDGCTCHRYMHTYAKSNYGRGAGEPMICRSGEDQSGALCYPQCRSGYKGIGPVCWMDGCPQTMPYQCGLLCTVDSKQCENMMKSLAGNIFDFFSSLIKKGGLTPATVLSVVSSTTGIASVLINDVCEANIRVPSYCLKSVYLENGSIKFASCSGQNSFDCGLFCTNNEIKCAKETTRAISAITGLLSDLITPTPTQKQINEKFADFKTSITKANKGLSDVINIIKTGKALYNTLDDVKSFNTRLLLFLSGFMDYGETLPTSC